MRARPVIYSEASLLIIELISRYDTHFLQRGRWSEGDAMSRTASHIIAIVIASVSVCPDATSQAKSAKPASSTSPTPRKEPDLKQAQNNPRGKLVINARLVNLTVSVNDKHQ